MAESNRKSLFPKAGCQIHFQSKFSENIFLYICLWFPGAGACCLDGAIFLIDPPGLGLVFGAVFRGGTGSTGFTLRREVRRNWWEVRSWRRLLRFSHLPHVLSISPCHCAPPLWDSCMLERQRFTGRYFPEITRIPRPGSILRMALTCCVNLGRPLDLSGLQLLLYK